MQTLFKQYNLLQAKLVALEEEKEILRASIVAEMKKAKLEKVESSHGIFTIAYRITYKYSPMIRKLEEALCVKKIREQEKGIAEKFETEFLRFTQIKEENDKRFNR